jgi:hypothetical protein
VVPEDSQPGRVTGARVVNVQCASVIESKIGLGHHMPSLTTASFALALFTLRHEVAPAVDSLFQAQGGYVLPRHADGVNQPSGKPVRDGLRRW